MNPGYDPIIAASDDERRVLFLTTADRLNTDIGLIEKDFWVCWTLDALFHGLPAGSPRLLFKGGTSLSKAFDLIKRFSEDIDLVVFRNDLGQPVSVEEIQQVGGRSKQNKAIEEIVAACQGYIQGQMLPQLGTIVTATMDRAGIAPQRFKVTLDANDADGQSILFAYPSVLTTAAATDIETAVKIEAGARSALDPHGDVTIRPYADEDLPRADLSVPGITTVDAGRTFWDKVIILHGLRQNYDARKQLRQDGQRVSRHYFDVHTLLQAKQADDWIADTTMAEDCARHARMFFSRASDRLDLATRGSYALTPVDGMRDQLAADYDRMRGMIFGVVPALDEVLESVAQLEKRIN